MWLFDVDLQGLTPALPVAFAEARAWYESDSEANIDRILHLLHPYARALFIPSSLPHWELFFADPSGDGMPEIRARWVRVCKVDFLIRRNEPFPCATMEAGFEVPVVKSFDARKFERWERSPRVCLEDALSFGWNIPASDSSSSSTFFPYMNHSGTSCFLRPGNVVSTPKDLRR